MGETSAVNELSGHVSGAAVQAGTVHGGVHLHADVPARPVPRQLPADVAGFTGREEQLAWLDERAREGGVVVVTGTAGVGKTSVVVRWAHSHLDDFPDGQLYVDLHGSSPRAPVTSGEALTGFLHSLHVHPETIPVADEDKAALYRSLTHGRRLLVVVDNAADAEQVRPLLPAVGTVLVTSRNRLAGLVVRDGAVRLGLDVLPAVECLALLRATAGADRVDADPDGAARLAEQCAYLPLALRVAAERVAADPFTTLADLTAELAAEEDRLDLLSAEGDPSSAVRAVFSWSYRSLSDETAAAFRALGLHPTPEFSLCAVTALLDATPGRARRLAEALATAHLVQRTARDRYRLHDLLRVYAVELAADDPGRAAAIRRVLAWYLYAADAADRVLLPLHRRLPLPDDRMVREQFTDRAAAMRWCEAERVNLVAAVRLAADSGEHAIAARLPVALCSFFDLRKYWLDWATTFEIGRESARATGDRPAEAHLLYGLGTVHFELRQDDDAAARYREALELSRGIGDGWGVGAALAGRAYLHRRHKRLSAALDDLRESLAVREHIGDERGVAITLNRLGSVYRDLGLPDESLAHLTGSLEVRRRIGDRHGQGYVFHSLAVTYEYLDQPDRAVAHYRQAVQAHHEVGNVLGEAKGLDCFAKLLHRTGDVSAAGDAWRRSIELHDLIGSPETASVRRRMTLNDTSCCQDG